MPPRPTTDPSVTDNPDEHRYELRVGSTIAGLAYYRPRGDGIEFTHTEVDPAYEGQGLGSRLAAAVLDDAGAQGLAVTPTCPFIAAYIRRHPQYLDLVDPSARRRMPR